MFNYFFYLVFTRYYNPSFWTEKKEHFCYRSPHFLGLLKIKNETEWATPISNLLKNVIPRNPCANEICASMRTLLYLVHYLLDAKIKGSPVFSIKMSLFSTGITAVLTGVQKEKKKQIEERSVDLLNPWAKFYNVLKIRDYVTQQPNL